MIKIHFLTNQQKQIVAFSINGHAGYAVKGSDIVCSAVSFLSLAITNHLVGASIQQNESGCLVVTHIPLTIGNIELVETLRDGLIQLAGQYPKHVQIV